jgi:hypothetical protein
MINRSVPITVAIVLVGGIGVTSALGSLGGDPTPAVPSTVVTQLDTPEVAAAEGAVSTDVASSAPLAVQAPVVVAALPGAALPNGGIVRTDTSNMPPAGSIARGGDDDDDEYDDHDDEDDEDDDDHDDEEDDDDDHDEDDD